MKKFYHLILTFLILITSVFSVLAQDSIMLATFQEESVLNANVDYYDTWSYNRNTDWLPTGGDQSSYLMISCRGNFNTDWEYDQNAPDETRAAKFTTGLTTWSGWTQPLFDFVDNADKDDIQSVALPEGLTAKLKSGEQVLALDVYFEDLDETYNFDSLADFRETTKLRQGIKVQVRMQNAEAYSTVKEVPAFLTKLAYISEPDVWQTLYFVDIDTTDFTQDDIYLNGDNIDRFMIILNYRYPEAVASNYWIKNLRVVDNPGSTTSAAITDQNVASTISIYPNPASEIINVHATTDIEMLTLYDLTGNVVLQQPVVKKANCKIDLSGVSAGIYIMKTVTINGFTASTKVQVLRK